ncbi:tRNA 2-selenouridine(34) synthase MnmH [Maricaulis maris]|uniref:tRNA 2-selenouridine(34) synthase MnmH n=1 Tax=Maricaulis maris TaxID=74318 RepID=UPI0026EB2E6C|nr:tRNA 2-selenouridine(34) synthase MnmH [Maricaulis maris]
MTGIDTPMQRIATTDDLSARGLERFDAIIDVRSPSEYAEDHLPGAINLPVLDDEERARVGTHYTQVSIFEARRMGAAIAARNISRHIAAALADKDKTFKPLVYCWRGGMRSQSMATILAAVGWKTTLVDGGYRTWRRQVVAELDADAPLPVILIDGQTGTAKTRLLHVLAARGEQVLDLEGLACHRGSIFGDFSDNPQPGQKAFETALWTKIRELDPSRPVYVEAESRSVGRLRVPPRLWNAMQAAPRLEIRAPVAERARYLMTAYPDLPDDPDKLLAAIDGLRRFHARSVIEDWQALAGRGDWQALAAALVTAHYDPAYDRARKRDDAALSRTILETDGLDDRALGELAGRVIAATPAA